MAIVTTNQIAKVLDMTERRVQQLSKEGMPKEGRGKWDVIKVIHWYIKYLRALNDPGGTVKDERIKTEQVKRQKMQMEIDKEIGELFYRNEIMKDNAEILLLTKQNFLNLSARTIKTIAREFDIPQSKIPIIKKYIDKEVIEILNHLSNELSRGIK